MIHRLQLHVYFLRKKTRYIEQNITGGAEWNPTAWPRERAAGGRRVAEVHTVRSKESVRLRVSETYPDKGKLAEGMRVGLRLVILISDQWA